MPLAGTCLHKSTVGARAQAHRGADHGESRPEWECHGRGSGEERAEQVAQGAVPVSTGFHACWLQRVRWEDGLLMAWCARCQAGAGDSACQQSQPCDLRVDRIAPSLPRTPALHFLCFMRPIPVQLVTRRPLANVATRSRVVLITTPEMAKPRAANTAKHRPVTQSTAKNDIL